MSIQKAGVPGSPGCIKHMAMIWHTIQIAKWGKKDLLVLWLDLANAYGAIPHAIIIFAMEFFHMPERMQKIILKYYDGFKMRFTMGQFTTSYQALEVGIPMGCTISPILFVMAMEILTKAAQNVCKGVEIAPGMELPPLRAFMDDLTLLNPSTVESQKGFDKLEELTDWCRIKFKPKISRALV